MPPASASQSTGPPLRPDGHGPSAARPAERQRDPFLDNAKYFTIVLVALGHSWAPLAANSRAASALYMVVYAFHMPAFIIVSGYLSRSYEGTPRQLRRLVTGVALPYIVFQTLYTLFMRVIDNPDREFHYQQPGFALWFLVALFLWRLTTPLWKSMRWPLPVSLVIAAGASVTPSIGADFDLMRIAQFLPFFVLGLKLRPDHFRLLRHRAARPLAAVVGVGTLGFAYWAVPKMSNAWLLHDKAAQELGVPAWTGVMMTFALFGCSLVLTAAFLAWVPRHSAWFTALGAGTLYAYLLHIYPIRFARVDDWYAMDWVDSPLGRLAVTVLAAAMMTLLCTSPVRKCFHYLVEPKVAWFFPAVAPASPAPHPGTQPHAKPLATQRVSEVREREYATSCSPVGDQANPARHS
ncbi:acyltransferase family protein [Streptomyces sp. NPDC051684]|uniref:acyltransferase family protein n=1 Tax=Streptomyces sp. NPDC051684 TaxID=3365670 RepID=UPI00379D1747